MILAYLWEIRPRKLDRMLHGIPSADAPVSSSLLPTISDMPSFIFLAMTGIFGNQLFFILGLARSSSITAAIIQPLAPVWTAIFAIILKIEKLTNNKLIGIAIAVLGSLVTLGFFDFNHLEFGFGTIFFFLNTACMGAYFLLQKPLLGKYPPITTTAVAYVMGALMMAVAAILFRSADTLAPLTIASFKAACWPLLYTILGPSIGTYLLVAYANSRLDSTMVSASKTLQPLSASFLAYIILGESLSPNHIFGALLLIAGMLMLIREYRNSPSLPIPLKGIQ